MKKIFAASTISKNNAKVFFLKDKKNRKKYRN